MGKKEKNKIPLAKDNFYTALALFLLFLTQIIPDVPKTLGGIYTIIMVGGAIASLGFMLMSWIRYFQKK